MSLDIGAADRAAGAMSDAPEGHPEWVCSFLHALADEACDYQQMLRDLERSWLAARRKASGRRSTSRAALAIDVLAAAPLLSATTLARATGPSIKSATTMLDGFVAAETAVEVTHRSARRLFGLAGMAPVREATTVPRRSELGRGRASALGRRSRDCRGAGAPANPGRPFRTPIDRLRGLRGGHGGVREGDPVHPLVAGWPSTTRVCG